MAWRVEDGPEVEADLESIYDHLVTSHMAFGRGPAEAVRMAEGRVARIHEHRQRLAGIPFRGTRHDDLMRGLRHVTIGRAVYWFTVDERAEVVRVLAIYHGGQDHVGRLMQRLTGGEGEAEPPPPVA